MTSLAFFSNLGGPDLLIILLIVLVLFGAKKLPELARGMGQAMREFHKAKDDFTDELHRNPPTTPTLSARPEDKTEVERQDRA
jgi:sec-independent protein translocase protein TatA